MAENKSPIIGTQMFFFFHLKPQQLVGWIEREKEKKMAVTNGIWNRTF